MYQQMNSSRVSNVLEMKHRTCLRTNIEHAEDKNMQKNTQKFWDLFSSSTNEAASSNNQDDLVLEEEGSGVTPVNPGHEDDEDNDIEDYSGDEFPDVDIDGNDDEDTDNTDITFNEKEKEKDKKPLPVTDDEDEDEDDLNVGSGSGDFEATTTEEPSTTEEDIDIDIPTTPARQLTPCENLRNTAMNRAAFVPDCESDGAFKKQQCTVDITSKGKYCWCVDPNGVEITGTRMSAPKHPDCDFGENLSTCVFQLVQHSQGLLGAYKPKCSLAGEYEPLQCFERECWCVDKMVGMKTPEATEPPKVISEGKPISYLPPDDDVPPVVISPGDPNEPEIVLDEESGGENYKENNNLGAYSPTKHEEQTLLARPGLLAAVIGGAVVGLLCMVLLVMFIVYRMRKKDEGSYPLDEQKYQNYSYTKAPDKEFYA
ncbi:SDC-like protein [Mya arenaria]|uniref:Syndecan n=1 Tax=Mya arenaria TaxID=6604 RepID=A0ABY7F502_MYAAR|nr:SDC-like protein [Mya arenaria]